MLMINKLSSGMPSNEDTYQLEKDHINTVRTQIKTYEPSRELSSANLLSAMNIKSESELDQRLKVFLENA